MYQWRGCIWVSESGDQFCGLVYTELPVAKDQQSKIANGELPIRGEMLEMVYDYKYPGVYLDSKLGWTRNSTTLYKKGQESSLFPAETLVL